MQQKIFDMLLQEEEISWKNLLYDLVKTEQMNPWDINIGDLTNKYIEVIKEMQEHDLRISGKILLAAAILLKLKSSHLLDNDIVRFDALLNETDDGFDEEFFEEGDNFLRNRKDKEQYTLIPKHPQPRNRKVSIHDLVNALQNALASKKKVLAKIKPIKFKMPEKKIDIMEVIREIYHKVMYYSNKDKTKEVTFTRLLPPRAKKEDKVFTFLPLLHLEHQHKVIMRQQKPFEEIHVKVIGKCS